MASVEGITVTGVPGTISSLYWQVALNDGAEPPNYAVNHLDGQGGVVSTPMTISGLDSTVEFNEPVMLSRDPVEDMEAATKQYADAHGGIPDAPAVNWYYGRFNEAWATIPIQSDAPSDGQSYVRSNNAWSLAFDGSGYLPLTGGTITGNLTVTGVTTIQGPNSFVLSAPAGNQRAILGQTGTLSRWQLQLGDQIAEGVGNAGSNFSLTAYTNLGGFLGTWLSISRADGTAAFAGHVNINQGLAVNGLLAVNDITNFYVPGGTAGQVMTTNGTGGLSWTTPSGGGGPSGPPVTIGDTPPSSPAVGALWWDSVGGQLYVWYSDANSSQWVVANNGGGGSGGSYLPLSGGTLTGALNGTTGAFSGAVAANGLWSVSPGGAGGIVMQADMGNSLFGQKGTAGAARTRWEVALGDGATESGSNAGSNFSLTRYNDAGSSIDTPLSINRATGSVTLTGLLTAPGLTLTYSNNYIDVPQNINARIYARKAGLNRWSLDLGTAFPSESGSNSGSDFALTAWADNGGSLSTPLTISRATGSATFAANPKIQPTSGDASLTLSTPAGQRRDFFFDTGANHRWSMTTNQTAETGSSAGSDFGIVSYTDAGVQNTPFFINRATGSATFNFSLTVSATLGVSGSATVTGNIVSNSGVFSRSNATAAVVLGRASDGQARAQFYQGTDNQAVIQDILATGSPYLVIGNGGANASGFSSTTVYKPGGGAFADSSDERIKNIVGDYDVGLDEVLQLRPVVYTFKGNDTTTDDISREVGDHSPQVKAVEAAPYPASPHYNDAVAGTEFVGFVAQEVEQVFPDMVGQREGYIDGEKVADLRDVDTTRLIFALVNAVKTLTARVSELEAARGA
jgi:hypothetical protein